MSKKIKINIKPLSVNEVWQGRRFKTPKYSTYETACLFMLPNITIPLPPYQLNFVFGLSNKLNDIDNSVKPFTDILQKKYAINDRDIYLMIIEKVIVEKGSEYIEFEILSYKQLNN